MHDRAHEGYIRRCLELAKLASGYVSPNPMVGAVLVNKGVIIAEGYHKEYGGPHAEVHCINQAVAHHPEKIAFSTLYVSLEPCAHYGKTPPCADLIIRHKIPEVVIACRDSFEQVDGKGIARLQEAGVKVTAGVLANEAVSFNRAFFSFHAKKRPYIFLKWAQTADGFMAAAGADRLLITNAYTNRLVHKWRSGYAAIMVGANTAIKDDPLLDNRLWKGVSPKKILVDPHLKVLPQARLFQQGGEVFVFNKYRHDISGPVKYLKLREGKFSEQIMTALYDLQVQSVLVEGGYMLLQSLIDDGLWDEACVITNKELFLSDGLRAPRLSDYSKCNEARLLNDEIIHFKNIHNPFINAATGLF